MIFTTYYCTFWSFPCISASCITSCFCIYCIIIFIFWIFTLIYFLFYTIISIWIISLICITCFFTIFCYFCPIVRWVIPAYFYLSWNVYPSIYWIIWFTIFFNFFYTSSIIIMIILCSITYLITRCWSSPICSVPFHFYWLFIIFPSFF